MPLEQAKQNHNFDVDGPLEIESISTTNGVAPNSPPPSDAEQTHVSELVQNRPTGLYAASLQHVKKLLRQLLQDAGVQHVSSWERALIPILLQCTDDVNPDVRKGDDIDIRHYVKLKKIPGGRPKDTSYVSGVVFSKSVALKSMPRTITRPRIIIITFPLEYQQNKQHFMSLGPIMAEEQKFLRNLVNRIAALQPHLLLVQRNISGLALQYLEEANIAAAYNVKQSVLEAVSRCAQTPIISSISMLSTPIRLGKSAGFDIKTYVHKDIPCRKKTYTYISGCPKELGCTIVLRGADMAILRNIKKITEFMVYVVYNLKLEACLMRDEFVLMPTTSQPKVPPFDQKASSEVSPIADSTPRSNIATMSDVAAANQTEENSPLEAATSTKMIGNEKGTDVEVKRTSMAAHDAHDHLPDDIPMPTFYGDMVEKHQTKILSASPFVKFMQPYLLMRAREQERRLVYLKRLRDQDVVEDLISGETEKPQSFYLITPEMVHETVRGAPRKVMEVLHAVHDAEYDRALHNYQTQTRQWENYITANLDLFDPFAHQNIVVLYATVCTATTIPCSGPDLLALSFYNEHDTGSSFGSDCTLGQYVEDLCGGAGEACSSNGCERKMLQHYRYYVHGDSRISVFVEKHPCKLRGLQDSILMWSFCKICKRETQIMPMSESTWKYSFGKYLELAFWSTEMHLRAGICPHDLHRDHIRYFGYQDIALRIQHETIDLLEIVVPRARITWKVDKDLALKNDTFTKTEERINRFMASVKARIASINVESVTPEKTDACKLEIERMTKKAIDDQNFLIRTLQDKYMDSQFYEIVPLNVAVRAMQEKVGDWDEAFANFDKNFFPSEKDIRRLATLQLKKMFLDRNDSASSVHSAEDGTNLPAADDLVKVAPTTPLEKSAGETPSLEQTPDNYVSAIKENNNGSMEACDEHQKLKQQVMEHLELEETKHDELLGDGIRHLDLAVPTHPQDERVIGSPEPSLRDNPVMPPNELREMTSDHESGPSTGDTQSDQAHTLPEGLPLNHRINQMSSIPRPLEGGFRLKQQTTSPPLKRSKTQPTILSMDRPGNLSISSTSNTTSKWNNDQSISHNPSKSGEAKLSERLGLSSKSLKKHSLIPRSIVSRRNDSRVSALAKHFEQLSREFEKERIRERRQRAATNKQSRAYPMSSSKPTVEVFQNVLEAADEREPTDEDAISVQPLNTSAETLTGSVDGGMTESTTLTASSQSPVDTLQGGEETLAESTENDERLPTGSLHTSDAEGEGSDGEPSILDELQTQSPGELSRALSPTDSQMDLKMELPKHERSSLMKILTNFWAERSASGWNPLEYPLHATDHIFADSDVVVREDEPSSLIAWALSSEDYRAKLENIRQQDGVNLNSSSAEKAPNPASGCDDSLDVERTLLRSTGTHLKYQFVNGSAKMLCKIFYAEQFDAVRRKCGVADRIVESLSRCVKWDSKGGKTRSVFLKTLDERLVLKSLSPIETQAFLRFAPAYFQIMSEALFHELPSVIAKMLGFYQIIIKNPSTGVEIKWDVLVMENLFYDRKPTRIFDLKGSMRNRKIQSTGEQNEVLLDENMVEFIYESPLFAREHSKKLLRASVWNDTLFLARQNVMDYSLMIAVDEERKELVVGIIDCIRTYTWDKKLESWIKIRGFAGGGGNKPTVTSPKEYKSRFREAMARYVLQAPNCWHQFQSQQIEKRPSKVDKDSESRELERLREELEIKDL
ncbi:MAG: 1-phosphatidylinositol-3-phosphate 5-kinase [Trizodia sp. TS-e1964]|nr:MAG: 1-phosphatidylinositol-3-phosphate 5-kinase [Trizodia sp. TS-e1964]